MTTETESNATMPSRYDPGEAESRWYQYWESRGYFRPSETSDAATFVITIPPPNVTGDLHLGHALTYGIEDIIGRLKRMQGFNTLILPGTDHAGIATQNVVEKQLVAEGTNRHEVGREVFLERVWTWKDQYADTIRHQFQALGCAFDWSRERFTMDSSYVDAVLEFFIRLYEEGKIYRGWRVINWCVRCHSAISDIEVDEVTREDALYYLRYRLSDDSGDIVVATVRPETILGDVAVAVNGDDPRYTGYVGKTAILPLLGRELPIVADAFVDIKFGTGAVKITPAHDFADWEVAERHGLPMPIAIDDSARITEIGGPYAGQTVAEARESVLRDLESAGHLVKVEPYTHNVPTCERCGTVLEPLLSEQWFMDMAELAQPAIDAVTGGSVTFVPERWSRVYLDWMENIRPWTLSRQLWWGHRIPIYYCADGHATAAKSQPEACTRCGGGIVRQDPDVLDTWFSSALWPFAALGWPQETRDLERYYPTSFMNTSSQILYLWIARMIMTGLKFRGQPPFPVVLINPTILNAHGQRMSKSLGTGVDPLDLVREFGADALRFGLMTSGSTHQQDIRFSPDRVELARNFANKVWNIGRLILSQQVEDDIGELQLLPVDRWILGRLSAVIGDVTASLERFEFSGAGHTIHDFLWSEFADWYLEIAKMRLFDSEGNGAYTARAVLWTVLDQSLRVLHPYMPFLTEDIWQRVRACGSQAAHRLSGWEGNLPEAVMIAPWPQPGNIDTVAGAEMSTVMDIIRAVRAVRSEYRVEPATWVSAVAVSCNHLDLIERNTEIISRLARLKPLTVKRSWSTGEEPIVSLLVDEIALYLPLAELADIDAERQRLVKEAENAERLLAAAHAKLANESFVSRAPREVVERERERAGALAARLRHVRERLEALPG